MNTVLKIGAASALALAGVSAHASIPSPSGSSADAVLFAEVLNSSGTQVVASYAGDTGVSINTLLSGYSGTVLGSDANLAKLFAADASGDILDWGVQAAQGTSGTPTFLTTTSSSATTKIKTISNSTLSSWATGFTQDISTINTNSGGANSVEGPTPATSGVWDVTVTGTSNWYGTLVSSNTLGTAETLFSEVTNGTVQTAKGTYASLGTVNLSANGLAIATGTTATTPLPAAVWLLGSGLLGLTGVARRKLKG